MATIRNYRELKVWQVAEEVFDLICEDFQNISKNDSLIWTIKDQVIRSSGSIGANIAEGFARQTKKEFIQFLNIARDSAAESEVWITRMRKQNLIPSDREKIYLEKLTIIAKMLNALIRSLRTAPSKPNHNPCPTK